MSEKHTPGPWRLNLLGYETRYACHAFVERPDREAVCGIWLNPRAPEQEANARLIAAAPALLEALRDVLNWTPVDSLSYERARAAIRAAEEGER